ncbi:MAG TPA: hypothetical protein VNW73_06635 [Ktedonobacteraceae bacterium]|nr:hypothetical protein [Ktedonobacteraceae bacterium]
MNHAITPLVLAAELLARRKGLLAQVNEVVSINRPVAATTGK